MSEIKSKLIEIYQSVDELRTLLKPYEPAVIRSKLKPLQQQSISDLVRTASLVESILEVNREPSKL